MAVMKKLEELKKDSSFLEAVSQATTLEEVKELFEKEGVDVSLEELESICEANENGELSEEDLDNVDGGVLGGIVAGVGIILFIAGFARGLRCKKR